MYSYYRFCEYATLQLGSIVVVMSELDGRWRRRHLAQASIVDSNTGARNNLSQAPELASLSLRSGPCSPMLAWEAGMRSLK